MNKFRSYYCKTGVALLVTTIMGAINVNPAFAYQDSTPAPSIEVFFENLESLRAPEFTYKPFESKLGKAAPSVITKPIVNNYDKKKNPSKGRKKNRNQKNKVSDNLTRERNEGSLHKAPMTFAPVKIEHKDDKLVEATPIPKSNLVTEPNISKKVKNSKKDQPIAVTPLPVVNEEHNDAPISEPSDVPAIKPVMDLKIPASEDKSKNNAEANDAMKDLILPSSNATPHNAPLPAPSDTSNKPINAQPLAPLPVNPTDKPTAPATPGNQPAAPITMPLPLPPVAPNNQNTNLPPLPPPPIPIPPGAQNDISEPTNLIIKKEKVNLRGNKFNLITNKKVSHRLTFGQNEVDLSENDKASLDSLAQNFADNSTKKIKIVGYANEDPDSVDNISSRRVSLQRAITVRKYLIEKGVAPIKMNVQAMGSPSEDTKIKDRVDIIIQ